MTIEELQAALNQALVQIAALQVQVNSLTAQLTRTLEALKIAQTPK